jgi:transcriptional regulator with XRE-family HTH domain
MALGLTQEELGELLGKNRRTIQRWQDGRFSPTAGEAETLAEALRAVRPDLADQVLELGRKTAIAAGMAAPAQAVTAEVIQEILRAAAEAGEGQGMTPEGIRAAVLAALVKVEEAGVEVGAVVAGLKAET